MFAVVDIAGHQFKVSENTKYYVPRLKAEPNSEIVFDIRLLLGDDKTTKLERHLFKVLKYMQKF
jgi:ribosomal protein L21